MQSLLYKSCGLCAIFNFLVRLLFKCGFYSKAAYVQCSESAKPVKSSLVARCDTYSESETWFCECHKIVDKHAKSSRVWIWPCVDDIGPAISSRSFSLSAAYVQVEFGKSVASNQVRFLYTTSWYTRVITIQINLDAHFSIPRRILPAMWPTIYSNGSQPWQDPHLHVGRQNTS